MKTLVHEEIETAIISNWHLIPVTNHTNVLFDSLINPVLRNRLQKHLSNKSMSIHVLRGFDDRISSQLNNLRGMSTTAIVFEPHQ